MWMATFVVWTEWVGYIVFKFLAAPVHGWKEWVDYNI
jgi:hypothetical protein